jgi:putative FmdB family regulatory protein
MPIYEYNCFDCQQIVNILFRRFADADTQEVVCPHCQGTHLERVISKVTVISSGQTGDANSPSRQPLNQQSPGQEDPRSLARSMREAGRKAGQDLGREFNEVSRRLEKGESTASIEKSLRKRPGQNTSQTH